MILILQNVKKIVEEIKENKDKWQIVIENTKSRHGYLFCIHKQNNSSHDNHIQPS